MSFWDQGHSRRNFLRLAAVGAAGTFVGCEPQDGFGYSPEGSPATSNPVDLVAWARNPTAISNPVLPPEETELSGAFPLGVASGDASGENIVLWTRYDGPGDLHILVFAV